MSDNICTTKRLHVNGYISFSPPLESGPLMQYLAGMPLQPSRILPREPGGVPEETPEPRESCHTYHLADKDGSSISLVDWEGILVPMAILQDALHRKRVRAGIKSPSPEQLDQLKNVLEQMRVLLPPENE
jgi:hypothetical protein